MNLSSFLRQHLKHKNIGWLEIGEQFTRYALFKSKWCNVYLHELYAPAWHPECHNHPWSFLTILLWNGYLERVGHKDHRRWPGMILWRPAEFSHNVITPYGKSWSLIITGPGGREWGFKPCEFGTKGEHRPYTEYIKDYQ